jgi:hypothetical protein
MFGAGVDRAFEALFLTLGAATSDRVGDGTFSLLPHPMDVAMTIEARNKANFTDLTPNYSW